MNGEIKGINYNFWVHKKYNINKTQLNYAFHGSKEFHSFTNIDWNNKLHSNSFGSNEKNCFTLYTKVNFLPYYTLTRKNHQHFINPIDGGCHWNLAPAMWVTPSNHCALKQRSTHPTYFFLPWNTISTSRSSLWSYTSRFLVLHKHHNIIAIIFLSSLGNPLSNLNIILLKSYSNCTKGLIESHKSTTRQTILFLLHKSKTWLILFSFLLHHRHTFTTWTPL